MKSWTFDAIELRVSIPAQAQYTVRREGACTLHTFTLCWNAQDAAAASCPEMTLLWTRPIVDMQYQWHTGCGCDRTFRANWSHGVESKISSGSPLHCIYNDAGRNRYTLALDDCVTRISRQIGVREESSELECRVVIPLDGTGRTESYRVTLRIDETDCRYEEAIGAAVRWWEAQYPPMPVPALARQPMYSTWYSFHQRIYEKAVLAECARARALGMKTVLLDDGWQTDDNARGYAYCGDWQAAPGKIADMRAFVRAVHALDMKCVVWYSVPFIGVHSQAIRRFEGKTLQYLPSMDAYTVDPRYPEVRAYLQDTYVSALKDWDLDGFKLDFIDSFRMGTDTPACRDGMDIVVLEDAVRRLMVDVMKALTAIKPDVLIEFRQSYIGPAMREFGNMFRVSDCPNTTSANRVGMVDLRLTSGGTAVHSDPLVWNAGERVENAACHIQNALFSTLQLSVPLDQVPETHLRAIRFWTGFLYENRELLLNAPLQAECPQMLYPLVRTEQGGHSILACYERNYRIDIPASRLTDAVVVNANSGSELLLRMDVRALWSIAVCNCMGELIREETRELEGTCVLDVPECGLIRMRKIGAAHARAV